MCVLIESLVTSSSEWKQCFDTVPLFLYCSLLFRARTPHLTDWQHFTVCRWLRSISNVPLLSLFTTFHCYGCCCCCCFCSALSFKQQSLSRLSIAAAAAPSHALSDVFFFIIFIIECVCVCVCPVHLHLRLMSIDTDQIRRSEEDSLRSHQCLLMCLFFSSFLFFSSLPTLSQQPLSTSASTLSCINSSLSVCEIPALSIKSVYPFPFPPPTTNQSVFLHNSK